MDFVDGGTQGLALLSYLHDRDAVLVVDAMSFGDAPGTVHVIRGLEGDQMRARRAATAHESSAMELFETAKILGDSWAEVVLVGIETKNLKTGLGLSPDVEAALSEAAAQARIILRGMVESYVLSYTR